MDMKRRNVFRRLDELENQNLHLQVMLKSARADIKTLQAETRNLTLGVLRVDKEAQPTPAAKPEAAKPEAAPAAKPKPKKRKPYTTEAKRKKNREYARKYYAKKKAEKLAVTA